ncbi:hypothetical protein ACJIZ3_022230 [Penstemon smallii]|uniref:Uncharacterized protein n=1 Tax=Penstemon smallii TaxID=265156 RepID=A0ABD3SPA7_9LAMI
MLAAQSPLMSGHDHQLIKSSRKALQPKNPPASSTPISYNSKQKCIDRDHDSNKENVPPIYSTTNATSPVPVPVPVKKEEEEESSFHEIEGSFDASLAEELSAIRAKLERLRIDKEKTEKMLGERGLMLDLKMKDILHRGELQKQHEIEVDRLFRLNEIRLTCLQSNIKTGDRAEGKDENPSQVNAEN